MNRFTDPDRIHRLYRELWGVVPVGFSVIPFHVGAEHPAIPVNLRSSGSEYPLGDNLELVAFLRESRERGWCEVLQHGCTHEDFPSGFEFEAAPDIEARLRRGSDYLAETLGRRPRIFVPPHNALSYRGLRAVDRAGVDVLGTFLWFNPRARPWDRRTASNWLRVSLYRRRTGRHRRDRFVYPRVLVYGGHREFGCHDLVPGTTFEQLRGGLDEARRIRGNMCLATHFWELRPSLFDVLRRFIAYAGEQPEVRFVGPSALFAAAR